MFALNFTLIMCVSVIWGVNETVKRALPSDFTKFGTLVSPTQTEISRLPAPAWLASTENTTIIILIIITAQMAGFLVAGLQLTSTEYLSTHYNKFNCHIYSFSLQC